MRPEDLIVGNEYVCLEIDRVNCKDVEQCEFIAELKHYDDVYSFTDDFNGKEFTFTDDHFSHKYGSYLKIGTITWEDEE
jgi:hypothetical protein